MNLTYFEACLWAYYSPVELSTGGNKSGASLNTVKVFRVLSHLALILVKESWTQNYTDSIHIATSFGVCLIGQVSSTM